MRYHGAFSSASPHRSLVVPVPPEVGSGDPDGPEPLASHDLGSDSLVSKRLRIRRLLQAELLRRTFGVEPKE